MKKQDLYDLGLERLSRLNAIRQQFHRKLTDKNFAIEMRVFADYSQAMDDNMEATIEVASGILPEVTELHLTRCLESGVEYCICLLRPLKNGDTQPEWAIL